MLNNFFRGFSKKGFIGPIGDDLPSLVPIVVSLLLFFTIFSVTLNAFNSKNTELNKQTLMIATSRELKGDSIILSTEQFYERCDLVKLKYSPYSFITLIYPTDSELDQENPLDNVINDFSNIKIANDGKVDVSSISNFVLKEEKNAFVCAYKRKLGSDFTTKTRAYFLRYYPVAIQIKKTLGAYGEYYVTVPGVMAMVVWE